MSSYNETTNWRSNTLRAYESVGSIGAKYCYLNKVKPKEFYSLLHELIGNKGNYRHQNDFTFDSIDFDFLKLSKLLGEPLSIVNKLTLNAINHLPDLHSKVGYSLASKKSFTYCPICLSHGYHSSLHQIEWVTNCFVHNELLIDVANTNQSIKNLQNDIKLLGHLYDIWFVQSNVWDSAKSHEWSLIDNKLINAKAKLFISALINTEALQTKESLIIGNNIGSNLLLQVENTGNLNDVFQVMHQNKNMSLGKYVHFNCSPIIADTLLEVGSKGFNLFMYARQLTCMPEENPQWKMLLDNLPSNLQNNHSKCLSVYRKSIEEMEKLRTLWCRQHSYVHPPYDMNSYDRVPCQRIVTLNLMQTILNIEDSLIYNASGIYSNYSFTDISHCFEDIEVFDDLLKSDLTEMWLGYITLGQHEVMKSYTPGYFFDTDDKTESRRVGLYIPCGILTEISDQLLHALVNSWIWALYETEANIGNFENKKIQPMQYLKSQIHKLAPSAILEKTNNGIQLKIGTMVPQHSPDWTVNRLRLISHHSDMQEKSKKLKVEFDQSLVQRMKSADLYQRSINYLRSDRR